MKDCIDFIDFNIENDYIGLSSRSRFTLKRLIKESYPSSDAEITKNEFQC